MVAVRASCGEGNSDEETLERGRKRTKCIPTVRLYEYVGEIALPNDGSQCVGKRGSS